MLTAVLAVVAMGTWTQRHDRCNTGESPCHNNKALGPYRGYNVEGESVNLGLVPLVPR